MIINSKLNIYIGDSYIMDLYSRYEDPSMRYGDFLWIVETGDFRDWYIHADLLAMTGADEIFIEVTRGSDVSFDIEHTETVPGNYFGRPEDCYPSEDNWMQTEELCDPELKAAIEEWILIAEIED